MLAPHRIVAAFGVLVTLAAFTWSMAEEPKAKPAAKPKPAGAKAPEAKADQPETKPEATDTPLVPEAIRQFMQDGKYAEAVKAIDIAARKNSRPDYLEYLKGRALYLDKKLDEAISLYDGFEKKFPGSPLVRRARFGKGLALARKGDFKAAEPIYRAEAEYLLSPERKHEIAAIYLEFADRYFDPPKDNEKPDYQKALEFYNKALEVGPKAEKRTEVELLVAQCHQEVKQYDKAIPRYQKFIKDHPDSKLDIEARFRLGESQLSAGQAKPARRTWQDLLARYTDSKEERIAEASYKLSRTWGIPPGGQQQDPQPPNPSEQQGASIPTGPDSLDLGVAALEAFLARFPEHKLAAQAHLDIAQTYMDFGRLEDAVKTLAAFLGEERYQDREEIPSARNMLGQAYQGQKKYTEALAAWQEFLAKHPTHKAWAGVQRQIINTEYLMAEEKRLEKEYGAARKLYEQFLAKYPLDSRAANTLYLFGWMNYQEKKYEAAIADWRRLVSKYPGTNEASQAQYRIGMVLEQDLGKLEEALEQYRKVTWGGYAKNARRAIARMEAKTMRIETERVFRSDETPSIKLTSRNIESVSVRVYKVDMETYFRKMHSGRGVESLDIALIDPDKTFEFKVPDYARLQEIESRIEVPLPGEAKAGVTAVTVSSKTLEATTMVVQSDLDVIVKSSRDEVFVFAQNMRTGKAQSGVRLLISNGAKVFAQGTTGEDGVFQSSRKPAEAGAEKPDVAQGDVGEVAASPEKKDHFKELKDTSDVRVFAVLDGHTASNVVSLSGVGVAQGLASKGYIYTDRPAYRAGQMVHVRGVIRRVPGSETVAAAVEPMPVPDGPGPGMVEKLPADDYVIDAGKQFTLEVFDSRNRLVREEQVTLGKFGTFHAHFVLPPTSPQGQYRVLVQDKGTESYQGTFTVHEYKLEPVRLVIDTPRHVYYRGEEIEGTIRAEFYYGAPLAGREIRYQLAGEPFQTATTDEQGEVSFKLATREFNETQTLPLVVTFPERNLQTAVNFFLAAQGFALSLQTVRPVYVAGETFEVEVKATDAEGKPAAEKLKLSVLEKTRLPSGRSGERLVEEFEIATDKEEGLARQTLELKKGGDYVLRAEGTDRFDNPITGQYVVRISDDEDKVRLRILADRHSFKVGDTAKVQLHWREDPALCLVTYQGARILGYRLVELKQGANPLEIPMEAKLAPNFELAVAVMTDVREKGEDEKPKRRFHAASSPFSVQRDLKVKIEAKRKGGAKGPVRPGEEIEVTVTTTDPQGKPLAAELSLAMVEQSLLDRFAWQVPAMQEFFRAGWRESAMRTTSSITFAYRPGTRAIDRHLLAEEERLEIARGEEASLSGLEAVRMMAPPQVVMENGLDEAGDSSDDHYLGTRVRAEETLALAMHDRRELVHRQQQSGEVRAGQAQQQVMFNDSNGAINVNGVRGTATTWDYGNGQGGGATMFQLGALGYAGSARPDFSATVAVQSGTVNGGFYWSEVTAGDLSQLAANNQSGVVLLTDGTAQTLMLGENGRWGEARAHALAAELAESGAVLLPQLGPQETGYWNPSIVTDEKGKAAVTFTVPDRSTAWQLVAKGITQETLAGETTEKLTAKKDLFGEMKLPLAFTQGDEAEVAVSVHNDAVEKGPIEVVLKTTIGGRTIVEKKTIDVKSKGIHELVFKASLKRPAAKDDESDKKPQTAGADGTVAFELTVTAGERKDVASQSLPLKPYGMPVYVTASGSATSDTTAWVEAPKDMPFEGPSLEIIIGPTVQQSLLDIVLGSAPSCQIASARIASGLETATSDLMASLALQRLLGKSREAGGPQSQALDARVRSSVSLLVSSQNDDGGWSWTGRGGQSNRYGSARAAWALSLAKKAGYTVPDDAFNKALGYLRNQVAATSDSDYESKAILLFGLAAADRGDFALANRLYRNRPALSDAALVHLALAFAAMDRDSLASELLTLLGERKLGQAPSRRGDAKGVLPWSHAEAEVRALCALALQEVKPKDPRAKEQIDWLLAHRTGHRWSPDKATGPAALAVCRWFGQTKTQAEHYKLAVFVNDVQAKVLEIDEKTGTLTIDVAADLLKPGKQRINFQITGRGEYTYQCVLAGFVAADKVKSTTGDWEVKRIYEPAPLEIDGKEVPRGFGVLTGSYTRFRNPLTQLPVGRRAHVELEIRRNDVPNNTPEDQLEYLVVTEPLPSGATVVEGSVRGQFERYEVSPGAITFFVGNRRWPGTLHYELHGYLPGAYRAAPTVVRDAYRPAKLAVSALKALEVLPQGAKSKDKYRLSPQELFELGKIYAAKQDKASLQRAAAHLAELIGQWNVKDDVYKTAVETLLDVHLHIGPPKAIVRHFEIVKEKWPDQDIPFDKILKVGAAYHDIGEYERSYLVFRATIESSFSRESGVAGFLQGQGEFLRSVSVMQDLLREYPPESYAAAASYALAQRVYAKAPEAATDEQLRKNKVNRVDLVRRAWGMLESFLTGHPDDPAADQASFSAANALLELEAYEEAIAACQRYAERYPDSELLDSFWYIIGYCHFASGEHEEALAMCRKVAEARRTDKTTGRVEESPNKWQAVYILGQVYHSLGMAAEAIREYRRVEERFADARQSIEYFLRKAIELPEVTPVLPGGPVELELKFRNVATCDVKVYRIDLMKFSLLKQSLGGITNINLAGIKPFHETEIRLGDGRDYRDRTHKLDLPLEDEGAYLVVARGENLYASGLVLLTPLAVEVQEEAASGRVRTTVKDRTADKYVHDVHVKVIGTRNPDFVSGETDLRGVFVADGIQGTSTVIAQATPSQYAFFRGNTELGPPPPRPPMEQEKALEQMEKSVEELKKATKAPQQLKEQLLENLRGRNMKLQEEQVDQLQQMYDAPAPAGVKANKAF